MSLVTLTTDFGVSSPYVAAMKGVILSIAPQARIVDLTHAVPPQDVREGAWILSETSVWFPDHTLHVAVVDPGVGSARRIVYAEIGRQRYLAPDNGLLSRLAWRTPPTTIVAVERPELWLPHVSKTFHGRDILAPVAARLCLGLDAARLGSVVDTIVHLEWAEVRVLPGKVAGAVRSIDSFGNLITDISAEMLSAAPRDERTRVVCDEHETLGLFGTYSDQPPMTFLALIGSSGFLELAIVDDSAAEMLGIAKGTPVSVLW